MAMGVPRPGNATTALQIHRRCGKPPNRRIERELYPELDRGARRRNAGAHADQSAQAPDARPARHHARPGLSRVRRFRPRLYRRGCGPVVRVAGIWPRAARPGRRRADAQARLLPSVSASLERTGRRAGGNASQNCARAHGAGRVPVLGLGGERYRRQARLVLLECRRAAAAHQDHRAPDGLPRQHLRRRQSVGQAGQARGIRLAVRAVQAHRISPLLSAPRTRRDGRAIFRPHGAGAEGPDTIAAFFAEPVMGAGGAIVPPRGYFEKVQAVLRKYDILFVADEVICGFARTGEMWGSRTYALRPDMMTSAKALSAAMQPISAVLINERIHDAMLAQSDKLGKFAHGFTYAGHPVAAAVALEVQKIYAELDIVARAKRLGPLLQSSLGQLKAHPLVGDVRGVGLILGMELMRDGGRRIPFDSALNVGARVDAAAQQHGLLLRVVGDRLVFAPPLVIEASEIEDISARLERALDDVADDLKREGA